MEFSDKIFDNIIKQTRKWLKGFSKTDGYKQLSEYQKDCCNFAVETFSEHMYSYCLEQPKDWSEESIEEILLDVFPRKLSVESEFYDAVEPILTGFLGFLQQKNHISNADVLIKSLKKHSKTMVKNANDSGSWGFAKQLMMDARDKGVDFNDETAISEFIQRQNQKISAPKVQRNASCPCGSGKKYKKCCGS
jgi:hypothetical protein